MKPNHRPPAEETLAAKFPGPIAEAIRQAAREEDRTVSSWMRRHFADVFAAQLAQQQATEEPTSR